MAAPLTTLRMFPNWNPANTRRGHITPTKSISGAGSTSLSLGLLEEKHSGASATTYGLTNDAAEETAYRYYDNTQLWIMEHYPDSLAAQTYRASAQALAEHSNGNGITTYSGENGYYTYIYTPPVGTPGRQSPL